MALKIFYLVNFLDMLSMSFLLPLTTPYILSLGGSLTLTGFLTSMASAAQFFASPVIGSWSDTRGRKLMLLGTLSVVIISDVLSSVPSLPLVFLARFLYGVAHQTDPLLKALLADSIPQENLVATINNLMAYGGLAFVVGPVLGGVLFETFKNFAYISIILTVIDFTTLSVVFLFVEEKKKTPENKSNTSFMQEICRDITQVFVNIRSMDFAKYKDLLIMKVFVEASFSFMFTSIGATLMKKFLFTRTQIGLAVSYMSLSMIAANFMAIFVIKKVYGGDRSEGRRLLHAFILIAAMFSIQPAAQTATLYLLTVAPLLSAKALLESTWTEMLSKRVTEADKGVMMGAASSTISLAGLLCPLIGGLIGDFIGITAVLMLPTVPAILGTIFVAKLKQN